MINEDLQKIINNKNLDIFYGDLSGEKFFILNFSNTKSIFTFKNDIIYKIENNEEIQSSIDEFSKIFKSIIDNIGGQNINYQQIIEFKEYTILNGKLIKDYFNKSFVLKQKINKNLQFLSQLNEALIMLINDNSKYKKNIKTIMLSLNILSKNTKDMYNRLDNLYSLMTSIKNDKLNNNIYFLSILSAIFLPVNLIVGFFGMNTEGMFLQNNKFGTLYILFSILIIFIICMLFYVKRKRDELDVDDFAIFKDIKV